MIDITNWQKLFFLSQSVDEMPYSVCLYSFHILGMSGYQTGHLPRKKLFMNKYIKKSSAYDEECKFFHRQGDANSDRTYKWMTLLCWCRLHACHNHDWWASIHQHLEDNKDLSLSSTFFLSTNIIEVHIMDHCSKSGRLPIFCIKINDITCIVSFFKALWKPIIICFWLVPRQVRPSPV